MLFHSWNIMLALWTCWVGLGWCHGSLFILGYFFPSLIVMHCTFTVICVMQMCFWNLQCIRAASKSRAVSNVCWFVDRAWKNRGIFGISKNCWWKAAGNAQVQVIWDSHRSHDGCDCTVHGGSDTIYHPGLTQTQIHPLVGFGHLGKLLLAGWWHHEGWGILTII